jgi:protein-tyrosine phosphatase
MPNVLFVCTANQFRSPLAAACFSRKLMETNTPGEWFVSSAGTWAVENLPAHPKVQAEAQKLGLDLSGHSTREVTPAMIAEADLIVVMEPGHKEALEFEFPECRGRVVLLAQAAGLASDEISDPARTDFGDSEIVAREVYRCINEGFAQLIARAGSHSRT